MHGIENVKYIQDLCIVESVFTPNHSQCCMDNFGKLASIFPYWM